MVYNMNDELYYFMTAHNMNWTLSLRYFLEREYKLQDEVESYPNVEFSLDSKEMSDIEFVLRLTGKDEKELVYTVYLYKPMINWEKIKICKKGVREFFGYYPREIYLSRLKGEQR